MCGERSIHNLALIGFMGTGKSCVGRLTADLLHFTFLDTDHVIEARAGKAIGDIFAQDGEPVFRQWEQKIVEELTRRKKTVKQDNEKGVRDEESYHRGNDVPVCPQSGWRRNGPIGNQG